MGKKYAPHHLNRFDVYFLLFFLFLLLEHKSHLRRSLVGGEWLHLLLTFLKSAKNSALTLENNIK